MATPSSFNQTFFLSPGILVQEFNLTSVVPSVATTPGAISGQFRWGPINKRILCDSENSSQNSLKNWFFVPDDNNYLTYLVGAQFLSYGGSLWVVRSGNNSARNATADGSGLLINNRDDYEHNYYTGGGSVGPWAARYASTLGNSIKISICPAGGAFSSNVVPTANTTSSSNLVIFSANVQPNIAAGDLITIGALGEVLVVNVAGANVTVNNSTIINATLTANTVTRRWAYSKLFAGAPGTSTYVANKAGANDQVDVVVIDQGGLFTGTANTVLERWTNLSVASDAMNSDGTSNYYRNVLFQRSRYIYWMGHLTAGTNWGSLASGNTFTTVAIPNYTTLGGGIDTISNDGDLETAYGYFLSPEDVDFRFILQGGADTNIGQYILQDIAQVRKDCVAYLSPQFADVVNNRGFEVSAILSTRNNYGSTSYGFMDSNWKYVYDQYNDVYRWIPCNGDTSGLQAQSSLQNGGIWVPGVGYQYGQIKNSIKLAWNPKQTDRDLLFPNQVNPIYSAQGDGTVVFGDSTLLTDGSDFNAIGIRMLFIILEKSIAKAAKYMLWKFNNPTTQAQFLNMVNPYLRNIQGLGGINDFDVVDDSRVNTPDVLQAKGFVGNVFIKPAEAIRYIQLNFVATPQGVTFSEIEGVTL